MRKFADQVPCGGRTEFPAGLVRQAGDIIVQLTGGQIRCPLEQVFALVKGDGKVVDQTVFDGIRAHRVGSAEIGLPLFEHRTGITPPAMTAANNASALSCARTNERAIESTFLTSHVMM